MFKKLKQILQGSSPPGGNIGANKGLSEKINPMLSVFVYKYSFTELPEKFFNNHSDFLHETSRERAIAIWSQHSIDSNTIAYIADFRKAAQDGAVSKALLAAAVYDTANDIPSKFYVLIEMARGLRIREVNAKLASWAVRDGLDPVVCDPEPESFAGLIRSLIQIS